MSFIVGFIFSVGLAVSGMTQPQKIIDFLNPWNWDPSLLFVMIGAVGVHSITYPLIRRRRTPMLDTHWHVVTRDDITPSLLIGAAIFGLGWGLGGYCPGPAVASMASHDIRALAFVSAMIVGMLIFKKWDKLRPRRDESTRD